MNAEMFRLFAGDTGWTAAIELALKSTLLLAVVFLGHAVARRRHVLACSALWNACVLGSLLLPVAIVFAPDFGLPVPWLAHASPNPAVESHAERAFNGEAVEQTIPSGHDSSTLVAPLPTTRQSQPALAANDRSTLVNSTTVERETGPVIQSASAPSESNANWRVSLLLIYAAGIILFALRFVLNLLAVQRLRSKATPIDHAAWTARLVHWSKSLGLRREVAIRTSDDVSVPVIVGWRWPMVLLPPDAIETLSGQRIDGVLVHELAHVRRGDYGWQLLLSLVQVIYWPQPLVWLAGRVIGRVRERACDDLCVHALGGKEEYRATLVDLARALVRRHSLSLGLTAVRSSKIARRLAAIDRSEGSAHCVLSRPSRWLIAAAFAGLAIVCGAANPTAPVSGSEAAAQETKGAKAETKAQRKAAARNDGKITGTVVGVDGKPVKGAEIQVYRFDEPSSPAEALKTDDLGQFSAPREWANWKLGHRLLVKHGDAIGFFDIAHCFRTAAGSARTKEKTEDVESFQIHLHKRTRTITGTIVGEDQQPIAGAIVRVEGTGGGSEFPCEYFSYHGPVAQNPLGGSESNERGEFRIDVPPLHYCTLRIAEPRYASRRINALKPRGDDLGMVVLAAGGAVAGQVIDAETGKPLAGAWIGAQALNPEPDTGGSGSARTDEQGRYEITGLYPGLHNVLFSPRDKTSTKIAVAHERVEIKPGAKPTADFKVITGRRLTGQVVDMNTGKPLADWPVGYYGSARPQSGAACIMKDTDAEGRFEFFVPPGETYVYIAKQTESHPQNNRRFIIEADTDPQPVILKGAEQKEEVRGGYITKEVPSTRAYGESKTALVKAPPSDDYVLKVRVRTADGKPMASAIYEYWKKGAEHWSQKGVVHGNEFRVEGGYDFGKPQRGLEEHSARNVGASYLLVLEPRGYARPEPVEFGGGKKMEPITIDLKTPTFVPIRGRVVDTLGQPIPEANVDVALYTLADRTEKPWGVQYLTDKEGRFEIKHTYIGNRLAIHISKDGWSGMITDPRNIDDAESIDLGELKMTKANGVIEGRVLDFEEKPIAGVSVKVERKDLDATTDNRGNFRLEGLPVGDASIFVHSDDYESYPRKVAVGTKDVLFKLFPKSPERRPNVPMIKGKFRTVDGKPVTAPSNLWWIDIAAEPKLWMSAFREGDGFQFSNVWPHPFAKGKPQRLIIDVMGYKRPEPIEVATNKNVDLTIELQPAEAVPVTGRVMNNAGNWIEGATVWTTLQIWDGLQSDDPWGPTTMTDKEGRFALTHIKDGDVFTLHIGKPGFAGTTGRNTAQVGRQINLPKLQLSPATATLSGAVIDRAKKPVADARVYTNYLGQVIETTTDKNGKFSLAGLPDGQVTVTVESDAFRTQHRADSNSKEVTIEERVRF